MVNNKKIKTTVINKRAEYDYYIHKKYEAGIVLTGSEVKSIRSYHISITHNTFCAIDNKNEVYIYNLSIAGNTKSRKLLLNSYEINKIKTTVNKMHYTIVPLRIYNKNSFFKIEIGICQGKKQYDKRSVIKERDVKRRLQREYKYKIDY